jgi:hypothetical protein
MRVRARTTVAAAAIPVVLGGGGGRWPNFSHPAASRNRSSAGTGTEQNYRATAIK